MILAPMCARHLFIILALLIGCHNSALAIPSFKQVQQNFLSSDAILTDRNGVAIHQLRINPKERKLAWVKLEDVSPALRMALIASEDKRFYQHGGVDWNAVAGAAWGNLWNQKTRGASTITMQLAGLLEEDLRRKSTARSAGQKITQAVVAQWLEQSWRKDQILEAYLNLVAFKGELVGVHALSRVMFDKHPSGLDKIEAAIAVALIRGPNASVAKVAERACTTLKEQALPQFCANLAGQTTQYFARLTAKSDVARTISGPQLAPHLAQHLATKLFAANKDAVAIRSTLDASTQEFARDALVRQLSALVDRNIEDGAVLVLDNQSGDVLAWVGSSGALSDANQVDGVLALRQAGSTLKPFLYELAIEKKWLTAASILDDSAVNLPTASGLYIPQNYDKHFKGLVSVRTALGSSLNIPAVRTLVTVTPELFFQRLQQLGFGLRESGDYYGYSLALGSADVSLLALSNAYRTLANQGQFAAVRSSDADPAKPVQTRVMAPAAAFIVGDILSDRAARAITFGLENALATRIWSAVKTGTSKDMRDNWCVGYSDRYTVGVWVGNASGAPMWDVSGVTGAAPVWQEVMQYLHQHKVAQKGAAKGVDRSADQRISANIAPAGIVMQAIAYEGQLEAPRSEYFLPGTEQTHIRIAKPEQIRPAIRYPTAGMLVAIDPDIPSERQRIRFAAQGVKQAAWLLDGKAPVNANKANGAALSIDWMPWPGKHLLQLVDSQGQVLDQLRFEVRGAIVAAEVPHTKRVKQKINSIP
ncbi:MAG: penicillin-binding protein 1C [Undibacterium sp.]|uniref:penicillin-binding protein 1C n=1 Tax=Undibacterium sp. TaxID=1914977 RepID=UPI002728A1DA|nr:penicillin-binding protein 1C [Undibacterium sp.]MDO8651803.1 penicillin-binding protein 1C [Undibacterium sp.]